MDLKDKFDNYQTEVDAEAWEHFQMLRGNQRSKRRFFWWWFFGGIAFIGVVGLTFWKFNQSTIKTNENLSAITIDTTTIITKNEQQKEITSENEAVNILKEKENVAAFDTKAKNTKTNYSKLNKSTNSINENLSKTIKNQKISGQQRNLLALNNQQNTSTSEKKGAAEKLIDKKLISAINQKKAENRKVNVVADIESPVFKLIAITDTIDSINISAPASLIKPLKRQKNTLKFGVNFADAVVNGFSLENPVNKQGPALQLEYYHEWNKIIGTGISAGYVKMVDRNNPTVAIKGRETIKFLHANLYLFLYNEKKHKVYAKVGAGLTNTDRVLGTFLIKANGEVERTFQINNLTDIGYLVEGAYEYKLSKSFIIGANYSIISHNDGGWYTGLSIGYQF